MFNVRRRKLVKLFGSAAATWPLAARAQSSKVTQLGALYLGVADGESFARELREGMRQLGYVEGQNLAFAFRSAEGRPERLPELAAELVGLKSTRSSRSTSPAHWQRSRRREIFQL